MTETTIDNYQERAFRTLSIQGSNAVDGAHMALGITTETQEMEGGIFKKDMINIREEHGDINWYIANECNIYDLNFVKLVSLAKLKPRIPFHLHNIVDLHKRELAYGKEMNLMDLEMQIISLIQYLMKVARSFKFDYEESLSINIDKLYKRYPDKFTNEKALNRDLEAEHETLK